MSSATCCPSATLLNPSTAVYDGGGVALDASSDSYDTSLTDSEAFSTLECRGGAILEANEARERGGAFYVTRGSRMMWNSCTSTENSASLGTSIYASNAELELGGDSILAQDSVIFVLVLGSALCLFQ